MSVMKEWKVGINLIFKQPLTASIVAIVGSFLKLVCSIVLFHGIRKNKGLWPYDVIPDSIYLVDQNLTRHDDSILSGHWEYDI